MHGSSGCVGVFNKPPPVTLQDKPPRKKGNRRGMHGHGHPQKDWWSSSSNEMDSKGNSRSSQRSTSSIGVAHSQDNRNNTNNNTTGFINNGLDLWTEQRRQWVGNRPRNRLEQRREPVLSWSANYEDLLSTNQHFPQPIPLAEMVDFLTDVWEQEGLYD